MTESYEQFPSIADGFGVIGGIALILALVGQIQRDVPVRDPTAVLDASIVATSAAIILWVTVMAPSATTGPSSVLVRGFAVAYPSLDILMLGLLGYLWMATRDHKDLPLFAAGVALLLLSDAVHALRSTVGLTEPGGLIRPSALVAILILAIVAIRGPHRDRVPVAPRAPTRFQAWLLVTAAVLPLALAAVNSLDHRFFPASETATILVISTILAIAMASRLIALLGSSGRVASTIQQHRFEALAQASTDVIAIVDRDHRIRYVSPTSPTRWQRPPHQLVGRHVHDLIAPPDHALFDDHLTRVLAGGERTHATFEVSLDPALADGARAELILVNLVHDPSVGGVGLTVRDVTERVEFERTLARQAFHDGLTGLANRALFADRLDHALAGVRAVKGRCSALLFIDLDDFKRVNDSLGHSAGDELLVEVAKRIGTGLREQDTAARIGGDEFAVLLEDLSVESEAEEIAARMLKRLDKPTAVLGSHVSVAGSIGIRVLDPATSSTIAMRDADLAMYRAKRNGKGRYEVYAPELHAAAMASFELRSELEAAVRDNQMALYYQTIHDLTTHEVVGAEALLRWQHPERGVILPDEFIPIAEQSGLIVPIGGWAFTQACADIVRLSDVAQRALWVSVNVSPLQFSAVKLTTVVRNALTRARLNASQLRIEITESVFLDDSDENVRVLDELRAMGARIAIDDFGTGYSSLSYLQRYPIDVVKIDRSFVTDAAGDPARLAITESILRLADALHLSCVAEGIESTVDRAVLESRGCRYGQGFLYSRPMPLDELELMLAVDAGRAGATTTDPAGARKGSRARWLATRSAPTAKL